MNDNGTKPAPAPAAPITITWTMQPAASGKGYTGTILVPLRDGKMVRATKSGPTKAKALGGAAALAKRIEDNPVLQALLPPQAALALKATTALAKAATTGKLKEVASKFAGPAMDRIAKLFGGF